MKRHTRAAALALLLSGLSVGCASSDQAHGPAEPSVAPQPPANKDAGIVTSGRGVIQAAPDMAQIRLGVEVQAATMGEARARAAEAAERIIDTALAAGLERHDLQTSELNIGPGWDDNGRPKGFIVSNILRVTVRDLTRLAPVVDGAISAAGGVVRVHDIQFEVTSSDQREAARKAAFEEAKAKAKQLAALSGKTLGEPLSIVEEPAVGQPFVGEGSLEAATPILPGRSPLVTVLTVRWALDEA